MIARGLLNGAVLGGAAIAVISLVWFFTLLAIGPNPLVVWGITAIALAAGFFAFRRSIAIAETGALAEKPARFEIVIVLALLIFTLIIFGISSYFHPFGDWDALMVWNFHAVMLTRLGVEWKQAFTPLLFLSHPDYPLLIPGFIAAVWQAFGEMALTPVAVAMFFFFATAALLYGITARLDNPKKACLAVALFLSTPAACYMAANQYCENPIAFYLLASVSLLMLYDRGGTDARSGLLLLSGFMAGALAWTKNEGLLYVASILAARALVIWRTKGFRECFRQLAWLALGIAVPLGAALMVKHLAPPNDIVSGWQSSLLPRLTNGARWLLISQNFILSAVNFGTWLVSPIPLLLVGVFLSRGAEMPVAKSHWIAGFFTLVFALAGFFFIYLTLPENSPYEQWFFFSLGRLFLQLWPTAILLFVTRMTYTR